MRKRFAVFDTETTGLTAHFKAPLQLQPRPIEFGGLITDGVEIIDTLEFICNPGMAIEAIITEITGLTNADLDTKPPFEYYIDDMAKFFDQADIVIAHNLAFDTNILKYALRRLKLELGDIKFPRIPCCTVEQFQGQFGRRMKLTELYNMFVGEYVQKHRALDDVKLLHEICQKMGVYNAFSSAKG